MADESRTPSPEEVKRVLQEAVLRHYPNPERIGCPGSEILKQVAREQQPYENSHWEHIQHCSPCYKEFLDFRREFKRKRIATRRLSWAGAIAALFLIGVAVFAWQRRSVVTDDAPVAVLNLESTAITRGSGSSQPENIQHLPRRSGRYEIYLPLGSIPGPYQVEFRQKGDPAPLATFTGSATIRGGTTVLRITADLTKIPPATYFFAYRRDGGEWRELQVALS
jgi:hypothetical protein